MEHCVEYSLDVTKCPHGCKLGMHQISGIIQYPAGYLLSDIRQKLSGLRIRIMRYFVLL